MYVQVEIFVVNAYGKFINFQILVLVFIAGNITLLLFSKLLENIKASSRGTY